MKNKFKKIMATTLLSATAISAIGCATTNTKIAQKINNGVNDFVSSINKLDYVDTNKTNSNLGKIVSAVNDANFISKTISNTNIENTITRPSERTDNFKLYVLSDSPYISLTSDDNSMSLSVQFSTQKIENTSDDISEKINKLILKRAILMVYVNEIYSGNVNLTYENRKAINAYVNVIKENASFLNGNRGMVKNQLGIASDLINNQSNDDIVNYYIIKSGEALEIRSNKIDSTISAIESIITILEQNLTSSSCYYQNSLTNAYDNMLSNLKNSSSASNENTKLAKEIAESINLINENTSTDLDKKPVVDNDTTNSISNNSTKTSQNNSVNQNSIITPNPNNTINQNISNRYYPRNQLSNQTNNMANNTTSNTINNSTVRNNDQKEYVTLEEKTQNRPVIVENQQRNSEYLRNIDSDKNLTPSQRARLNRIRNRNRARNNQTNQSNTISQNNQVNTNSINPTMNQEPVSPIPLHDNNKTIRAERTPERVTSNQAITQTSVSQNDNNRATRVPYKITSTSFN